MSGFSTVKYNKLNMIQDADAKFEGQLASAGVTRAELFQELAPIFLEEEAAGRRYAACLLHHHFLLNEGERLVVDGAIAVPSTQLSSQIVAESWFSNGDEFEHRLIDKTTLLPPPPSASFLRRFKNVIDRHGIDVLGICYAPEVMPGFILSERLGPGERELITTSIPETSFKYGRNTYRTVWTAARDANGHHFMTCCACCHDCVLRCD